jgi:hypothetical protein
LLDYEIFALLISQCRQVQGSTMLFLKSSAGFVRCTRPTAPLVKMRRNNIHTLEKVRVLNAKSLNAVAEFIADAWQA